MWKIIKFTLELMTTRMIDEVHTKWTTEAGFNKFQIGNLRFSFLVNGENNIGNR